MILPCCDPSSLHTSSSMQLDLPTMRQVSASCSLNNSHHAVARFHRSKSGRLIGVVLELAPHQRLLIVCAYMPTGLDHLAHTDPQVAVAHQLYTELMQWSVGMQQVVVMGDLNETRTRWERWPQPLLPRSNRHAIPTPMSCLVQEGFIDVYRALHPDVRLQPGFTHGVDSRTKTVRSRLDYIWCKGFGVPALTQVSIDSWPKLRVLSHHALLWAQLQLPVPAPARTSVCASIRLPNLRRANEQQRTAFVEEVEQQMRLQGSQLLTLVDSPTAASLDALATSLTAIVHQSASSTLPITGGAATQSKQLLALERQRHDLTRLLRISRILQRRSIALCRSPEWYRLFMHCTEEHELRWTADAFAAACPSECHAWLQETQQLIACKRQAIRKEQSRLGKERKPAFDVSPAATIHRMLQSDALPSQLYSVVKNTGELTTSAEEMQEAMASHFESVFALPPADLHPPPYPPPRMLQEKLSVRAEWYSGLMQPVTEEELLDVLQHVRLISAPGQDEVSSGVWKLALQGSPHARTAVAALFSACLRSSIFPRAWKSSVIVPLIKDTHKERTLSNIRPISLQSCLGKLLNKLLAHRLSDIFARHPILNASQRGFILGGCTSKCIDELLDVVQWSKDNASPLYLLFYDIKQAYDSVQSDVLSRAMHRLRLPAAFIQLVVDSLTELSSCVRTMYGLSRHFRVQRSLRQGDPLSPLLFVILMDGLHDGLEVHPTTGERHGCVISVRGRSVYIPSLGFADDSSVLTSSLPALAAQNEWVHYFMQYNKLRLNPLKCELVGFNAAGQPLTAAEAALHDICIEGHPLTPLPHDQSIRYLGVHFRCDGSWAAQQAKAHGMISIFTRAAIKFAVPLQQAVYMFNAFLLPKLELALRYVHGAGTTEWIKACDRMLVGCIKHIAASPLKLSNTAVALSTGLMLPSWLEAVVKVSELFIRMNSIDARWGSLGRMLLRDTYPAADLNSSSVSNRAQSGSRLQRAAYHLVHTLRWTAHLQPARSAAMATRHQWLLDSKPLESLHEVRECGGTLVHATLPNGEHLRLAHDIWTGWGCSLSSPPAETVQIYTDGSYKASDTAAGSNSAWSVVVHDAWLNDNHAGIPSDEDVLLPAHVAGATMFGAAITCTRGIYAAELQAIAEHWPCSLHASTFTSIPTADRRSMPSMPIDGSATSVVACACQRDPCCS